MDMIAEIRRRHLISQESISSIARDLKLSRPTVRNVSTTLIQPGSEFKLGYEALFELRGAGRVRQRLVLVWAIRGSDGGGAWVRVA